MANASSIIEYLPARLAAFQAAHPRIRVEVEERSSPEIPLALLDGSADGFSSGPRPCRRRAR